MKKISLLLLIVSLLFAGCIYEYPASTKSAIPVHEDWLGTWQFGPEFENAEVTITKNTDTEYMLTFPIKDNEFHTKAWHIKIGNIDAMQLQFLGSEKAPLDHNQFNIVIAEKNGNKIKVRFINEYVINPSVKSSSELEKAILKNIDNDALFHNPTLELTKTN